MVSNTVAFVEQIKIFMERKDDAGDKFRLSFFANSQTKLHKRFFD